MKKILILTYYYKHKNAMASVRSIKLAKYFSELGCDVTVLTSNQKDTWTKSFSIPKPDSKITEIYASEISRWTKINSFLNKRKKNSIKNAKKTNITDNLISENKSKKHKNINSKIKSYLSWLFYFNLAKQEDICLFYGLRKEFIKQELNKFDTVIATYPSYGVFMMGMWLKKHNLCKQFIADFRDPLYNPGFRNRKQEANYDLNCLKKTVHFADKIVCVSKGIAEGIKKEFYNFSKPIDIITNGYDKDDIQENYIPVKINKEKIHFVYTGTLYHGKRCVDMLAKVLTELISENKIKSDSFVFEYAGSDFPELLSQLKCYGLENNVTNHGMVSREESMALQKQADSLLLLTWNEKSYQGVVPGKLFEYMTYGNIPIIALITGDVKDSEAAQIIRDSSSGIACEEISEEDIKNLKAYILKLFNKDLDRNNNTEKYNYKNICKKYLEIIEGN